MKEEAKKINDMKKGMDNFKFEKKASPPLSPAKTNTKKTTKDIKKNKKRAEQYFP